MTWKGQPDAAANHTLWLHKTGTSDFGAANWTQLGGSKSFPADNDRYLIRHLDTDFAAYVDGATGAFEFVVTLDNNSELVRSDYVQVIVTSTP